MKRWIALLVAVVLLASVATVAVAGPLHIGGGPMLTFAISPAVPGRAIGMPAWVVLPAHIGGGPTLLSSPLHIGGGPNAL